MNKLIAAGIALFGLLSAGVEAQTTWYVAAGAAPPGAGTSASPFPSIQYAILAAAHGDLVLVGPGTYVENLDYFGKAIEVRGDQGALPTILDANHVGRGVLFTNGESAGSVLRGLTIRNGESLVSPPGSALGGGAILCDGTSPTIVDCILDSNFGLNAGAAIACRNGSPVVRGCVLRNNFLAGWGGGIYARDCPMLMVTGCEFRNNVAYCAGAGIHLYATTARIEGCLFLANLSQDCDGGGLAVEGASSSVDVDDCRFEGNENAAGGAALATASCRFRRCTFLNNRAHCCQGGAVSGPGVFEDCRFEGNNADFDGGALYGDASLTNCILTGNWVQLSGGAAVHGVVSLVNCTLTANVGGTSPSYFSGTAVNCIFWNDPPLAPGMTATYCDVQGGWPGVGNIDADPVFADPASGDFRLSAASPCRNAGTAGVPGGLPIADFEGHPRNWESTPDIGADEFCARLAGTDDDLLLVTTVDGLRGEVGTKPALPGNGIGVGLSTPLGSLSTTAPLLAASLHPNSTIAGPNAVVAQLWIDVSSFALILDGSVLLGAGWQLDVIVPPALSGLTARLQAAAFASAAQNGSFALTDAHDIVVY